MKAELNWRQNWDEWLLKVGIAAGLFLLGMYIPLWFGESRYPHVSDREFSEQQKAWRAAYYQSLKDKTLSKD
ncbi:MAG: hypothetical protein HRU19_10310 [Pseudobacteriovorax sp.]|nr:hypothetical protein [Pseudobacteriovorax sp.]